MSRLRITVALCLVTTAVVAGARAWVFENDDLVVTAYFERSTGLHPGDEVRVLGVKVGTVDSIHPHGRTVQVRLRISEDQPVPADAKAAIVAPALVSGRYVQLAPAYQGGTRMGGDAVIPVERTAVPVEWDDIKGELTQLAAALGPNPHNDKGALRTFVRGAADALGDNGRDLAETVRAASAAAQTLAGNSGNLFAAVRALNVLIGTLNDSDTRLRLFVGEFASMADLLDDNRNQLIDLLREAGTTMSSVKEFVSANRARFTRSVRDLTSVASQLARNHQNLANVLHLGPTTLANFYNAYDPTTGAISGRVVLPHTAGLANLACQAVFSLGGTLSDCKQLLGPVVDQFKMSGPPVALGLIDQNGTSNQRWPREPGQATAPGSPGDAGAAPNSLDILFDTLLGTGAAQ